jgi:dienelactone hydrolase
MKLAARISAAVFSIGLLTAIYACGGATSQTPPPPPPITVTVTVTPTTLLAGGTAQASANVANDPSAKGVSWTVTCASAQCGSVSPTATASGIATTYTAPAGPLTSDLMITITATSVANTNISKGANLTVSALTISVNPSSQTVAAGSAAQFTASVTDDPSNQGVSWTVSCGSAPCGTVSPSSTASGTATTYTAPDSPPAGDLSVTLTATAVANNSATASASITVPGINVVVSPDSATVQAGASTQFTATVANDPNNKGVTWSVTCSPGPCGTVSPLNTASGVATTYTAPATPPIDDLPVTVTATSVFNTGATASAAVTVPAITISLTPTSALLPVTIQQQFTATIANDSANQGVKWSLSQGGTACSQCGSISPATTASGSAATYTAPNSVPSGGAVTLTATSISDSTKSLAATITVSSGSVKLVPLNLDFGARSVGSTSPAKIATLTNTGNSALTVSGITITGTNPTDFALVSSTPCGASVAASATCDIKVTFKPSAKGSRTAIISIADSSSDSPQQVALSGTGFMICTQQIKQTLNSAPARTAIATFGTVNVPAPTGPDRVGTRVMRLVDSSREDPFMENGTRRELLVRFWYPAVLNQACSTAEYTPHQVWSYFSQLMRLPLPAVITNSCQDAPVAEGAHPVVVFTHGYTGTFTDYTFLFEELASRGYVVASVDHTYEASAVQFPDGRFVHSGFGSHLGPKLLEDEASLAFALSVRLEDLKFVADELIRLNETFNGPFVDRLDMSRMAVAGHSMGGLAAALAVQHDLRFKAGVIIDVHDGYVPEAVVGTTRTPVFILASGRERWTENECRLWNKLKGPRFAVNFEGAEHLMPSDAVWLAKNAVKTGTMGLEKAVAAVRTYVADFLDASLREYSVNPRLTEPSAEYPDARVVPPAQSLCSKPGSQRSEQLPSIP